MMTSMPQADLFLEIWREACRHLVLEDSIERIAELVADQVPAEHVVVRQVDVTRGAFDTVAVGVCRPQAAPIPQGRSECDGAAMREVLAWCRGEALAGGELPSSDALLTTLAPPRYRGRCLAAPLHSDDGPAGALLLLAQRDTFGDAHRQLLVRLSEPVAVALANTARVHELTRLREALEADKQALLNKLGRHDVADAVVGADTGLRAVMDQVEHVAATDVPVLIIGETGSGKEVLARAVHERSRRARAPIVRVNCGAIPPGLVDSELFGHERGSFTGAVATRHGWFERADGGTLFLDEIGELPLEAQVRLLRILQDGTFERVGGHRALSVNVRIIAATHRDLREMVARGSFREDLWYRIGVFPIQLPPLRERREDIPRLAAHFAARAATRLVGVPLTPTAEDLELLLNYEWPGNVRELAAVLERAAILGAGRVLRVAAALGASAPRSTPEPLASPGVSRGAALDTLDEAMRQHIELALRACGGRIEGARGAAAILRINPHTLRARMRKLGIDWSRFRGAPPPGTLAPDQVEPLDRAMAAHITRALLAARGRVEGANGAATQLAINPHTLRARMRKLGVSPAAYRRGHDDLASPVSIPSPSAWPSARG
jgi:transcriptional regulator with GAF, ATPase, and Fis domain